MSSTWAGLVFVGTLIAALALAHKPLGDYMARVLMGKRHLAVERVVYKAAGVDADADQTWGRYLRTQADPDTSPSIFESVSLRL
jgi:K+-transporting ATPase ATPase A chain